ncbi:MAG TPA: glycerol-3-phosphate ABC transporter ATP-binding protein, partial [Clostridiales bacterium]|nr:glycerol-3-phosphate ABC transporter ATP-binding protein [Clostridiales bacterium]
PKDRDIAMVFQNYALYPHMNVYENMAFGLKLRRFPRAEIDRRVKEAADILGIGDLLKRRPRQLSGGQRQRVALGRAIVREPQAFLMDEPLSNLDAKLRVQMRTELRKLHQRLQATTIYVTHDQTEAMTMGDRIVVMNQGRVQQVGTPDEIYGRPANLFVAGFIGSPPMNFLECRVTTGAAPAPPAPGTAHGPAGGAPAEGANLCLDGGSFTLRVPPSRAQALLRYKGRPVVVGIRPEDVLAGPETERSGEPVFQARVEVVEPLGAEVHLYLKAGPHLITARVGPAIAARPGDLIPVALRMDKVHMFDKETGAAV